MARKPATSTLLKQAEAQIAELNKQLEREKANASYANTRATTAEAEVEQVHAFLDAIPNSIPREPEGNYGKKNAAMTRLAAWLAVK